MSNAVLVLRKITKYLYNSNPSRRLFENYLLNYQNNKYINKTHERCLQAPICPGKTYLNSNMEITLFSVFLIVFYCRENVGRQQLVSNVKEQCINH